MCRVVRIRRLNKEDKGIQKSNNEGEVLPDKAKKRLNMRFKDLKT